MNLLGQHNTFWANLTPFSLKVRCRVESCGAWITVADPATDGKVKYICAQCCADPGRYQQV